MQGAGVAMGRGPASLDQVGQADPALHPCLTSIQVRCDVENDWAVFAGMQVYVLGTAVVLSA